MIRKLLRMRETGLIAIILVLFIVMSFASPYFLTWVNIVVVYMERRRLPDRRAERQTGRRIDDPQTVAHA